MVVNNLVGGAITILKNMSSSMGRIIPYNMENKKCSKPPTRNYLNVNIMIQQWNNHGFCCSHHFQTYPCCVGWMTADAKKSLPPSSN